MEMEQTRSPRCRSRLRPPVTFLKSPATGDLGRRAGHDLLPLSLMIRGVVSLGLVALTDR
ncbi:hypothetical protein E1287_41175 [Actinomadura sp. KC06]|nr:hypothetical protein E1287_41175 [Actinomadura sp. KC06]